MVFRPNMAIFVIGGFWANPASKHRSLIFLIEKNAFKTRQVIFLQRTFFAWPFRPWFLAIIGHSSLLRFLGKSSLESTFFYILDRKECFLDNKSQLFNKSKT